jgi:hypothetical protein
MFEVVCISSFTSSFLLPKNFQNILNAMLRSTRSIGDRAIIYLWFLCKALKQRTLIARSLKRINQQCLPLETLCGTVNIIASCFLAFLIDLEDNIIQIFSGFDIIRSPNNHWKLKINTKRYLLKSFIMCCNFYLRTSISLIRRKTQLQFLIF